MCHTIPLLKYFKVIADKQKKYDPARSMWLNRVFRDLAKPDEWHCLTIDCSGVNKNGPGRYRTQADDPEKQVCLFNKPQDDELYNVFISNRIKTENFSSGIYFKIDSVQGKNIDAEKTLKQNGTHGRFSKFDTDPERRFQGRGRVRKPGYEETFEHSNGRLESQLDPDFF